jgi:hypothetical protein
MVRYRLVFCTIMLIAMLSSPAAAQGYVAFYSLIDYNPKLPAGECGAPCTVTESSGSIDLTKCPNATTADRINPACWPVKQEWDFNLTNTFTPQTSGQAVRWTYTQPGNYQIGLRLTAGDGTSEARGIGGVTVRTPPRPGNIMVRLRRSKNRVVSTITIPLTGSGSVEGSLSPPGAFGTVMANVQESQAAPLSFRAVVPKQNLDAAHRAASGSGGAAFAGASGRQASGGSDVHCPQWGG